MASIAARVHQPIVPDVERLAIVAPSDPADLVAATPVLEAAAADPRWSQLAILAEPEVASLLDGGPCERHLVPWERGTRAGWLRATDADVCLLMTEDRSWFRIARRAGIAVRVGLGGGLARYDLTHAIVPPRDEGRRAAISPSNLWRDLGGLLAIWPDHPRPRLHSVSGELSALRRRLSEKGVGARAAYVLAAPTSDVGPAGLWPPERHAALLDRLVERHGLSGVVAVGEGDEDLAEEVVSRSRHPVCALFYEEGYATTKALVAGAALVVTTDSLHRAAAAAFDVPCLYLAGPGPTERGAVAGERAQVLAAFELECAPCLRARCPLGHHRCMLDLEVEPVVHAAERLLRSRSAGRDAGAGASGR